MVLHYFERVLLYFTLQINRVAISWWLNLQNCISQLHFDAFDTILEHYKNYNWMNLGYVHTMPDDSFSCRHEKLSGIVWTATAWDQQKPFTQIEPCAGAVNRAGLVS